MFCLKIRAGLPTTMQLSGIDLVTTEPAPTITLLPIVISPMITTFAPNVTLSPMIGELLPIIFVI